MRKKDNDDITRSKDEMVTPLEIAAVGMHEMYMSFRYAGFTRMEALKIVSDVVVNSMNDANSRDEE